MNKYEARETLIKLWLDKSIESLASAKLELKAGLKICQIIFEKAEGKARYKGKFKRQSL